MIKGIHLYIWAASMARQHIVESLISSGADINRGNYLGETALSRACLATPKY